MESNRSGGTTAQHLVTATLDGDCASFLTDHLDTLQLAWRACRDRYPFTMTAGVILLDHLHCILALPAKDPHRSARWGLLQELFQHVVTGRSGGLSLEARPLADAEIEREVDFIHGDPVRHGLVRTPRKWPYSSLHAYIASGLRPLYWSGDVAGEYGARAAQGKRDP